MDFATITPAECAGKIRNADSIAVLTGAGLSTAAGVPDFRGPKGLYVTRTYDPEQVFEISYFNRDPLPFFKFSRDFLDLVTNLAPTFTHRFLAELEKRNGGIGIVTQNIDGLHQEAGSTRVYPMHGDYQTSHCRGCGRLYRIDDLLAFMAVEEVPYCRTCGGVVKPDVVFFGEPVLHLGEAQQLVAGSDLLLVLGSSLVVYPAASLPACAEGDVVIVNKGPVGVSPGKRAYLADADLNGFFREVAAELG